MNPLREIWRKSVACFACTHVFSVYDSRVPDQNGVSLLYIMLEIHHSDREPLMCAWKRDSDKYLYACMPACLPACMLCKNTPPICRVRLRMVDQVPNLTYKCTLTCIHTSTYMHGCTVLCTCMLWRILGLEWQGVHQSAFLARSTEQIPALWLDNNKINNNNNNNDNNNCIERHHSRFLQSPHCAANCFQHVHSNGPGAVECKSCATHRALITCNMWCAMWYKGTAQLWINLTELKSHLFWLYFIGWTIHQWRRGGNRSIWRKPPMMSLKKCHILKPDNSSPKQDSNPHSSIGGRLGKQTCQPLYQT